MADDRLAELLKTQKSLTEWLDDIKHDDAEAIRREDNEKRERLRVLNDTIGLPFDKPTQFEASELATPSEAFNAYLQECGADLCALRLIPKKDGLPKLRMRGKSINEAYEWFKEQSINAADYRADFIPHPPDYSWATIFVVNKHGMQGEIIWGGHHQLTQGFHDEGITPHVFRYDFNEWAIEPFDQNALDHLKQLAVYLLVKDAAKQAALRDSLDATFVNDYLEGYFETADSSMGTWFIDYSQYLGRLYEDVVFQTDQHSASDVVSGRTGSPGTATGAVKIVKPEQLHDEFPEGSVLVCSVTTPDYVPLMQKACAVVTDQGGILSHAAIVARELKKPCVVGTGNATAILAEGQTVTVNADKGVVIGS